MSKVTKDETIKFIIKHLDLLNAGTEEKLSKEDEAVHKILKLLNTKPSTISATARLIDEMIAIVGLENVGAQLDFIAQGSVTAIHKVESKYTNPLIPVTFFGMAGGVLGKIIGGAGWVGFISTVVGLVGGSAAGVCVAKKPEEMVTLLMLQVSYGLCQRFPELKDNIIQAMGGQLFDKCHGWADIYGGWAKGIARTCHVDALNEVSNSRAVMGCVIL